MKIEMVALKPFPYGGKRLKPGQRFEVKGQSDARLLRALDRAADFSPPGFVAPPAKPRKMSAEEINRDVAPSLVVQSAPKSIAETIEMVPQAMLERLGGYVGSNVEADSSEADVTPTDAAPASDEASADVSPRTGKPKRQYRRRDMTSEG